MHDRRARQSLLLLAVTVGLVGCVGAAAGPRVLAAPDAVSYLDDHDDITIIDVRTPEEFAEGHLAEAHLINIQAPDFRERISELDRDGRYLVYCRTGNRSAAAVEVMAELGFTDVVDAGGFADLADAGAPTRS